MSRVDETFARLRAHGRAALMPFITAGYPSLDITAAVLPALEAAGADLIEIGIPFSDPIADGPVIAGSMHAALEGGTTPDQVFEVVSAVRPNVGAPLVAMVSDSIITRVGPARFVRQATAAGLDGLIVPDLDLREAESVADLAGGHSLSFTLLVAPTSPPDRIAAIVRLCRGFVYVLARVGITGDQDEAPRVTDRVAEIRRHTELPVAVGFGISTPEHVRAVTRVADGAIVGSALVRRMGNADDPVREAATFTAALAQALAPRSTP